ncbi:UPF0481 protein At3g47200-like [Macadamia integrifolia]|uniref:UPF0481 protein At3g47200-like n=1 Tax=Macadamia integrifolia TaxID=60698 RepID=UPI001C4ED888|nr:UPF0481 protein At3g47200-like [Macadamia integrifolia]XP_042490425.1 UPF0481 protein At3g47200-like [Macadamia integrifolia]XP_042490426.1 UPF0481 protein At3g47200-like [Macadamia integrifolia]
MADSRDIESEQKKETEGSHSNSKQDEEVKKFEVYMENEIKYLSSSPVSYTIHRIVKPIRDVKPEAYTPRMISVGPLHHGEIHLKAMEAHKLRLVNDLLKERKSRGVTLDDFFNEMRSSVKEVRQYYSELISLNDYEFVKMMVIDGCFLLRLILGLSHYNNDSMFNDKWMPHVMRDLILLENQLPFFM